MVIVGPNAQVQNFKDVVGAAFGYDFGFGRTDIRPDNPGSGPGTHSGLHGWVDDDFRDLMEGDTQVSQEKLDELGITQGDISAALGSCTISFSPLVGLVILTKRAHFEYILAQEGLQIIPSEV